MTRLYSFVLTPEFALFVDFDGTLVELGPDPDAIWLPRPLIRTLEQLAASGMAVAVLSGRDLRDLSRRVPAGLWRVGGHGLEVSAPHEAPPVCSADLPPQVVQALQPALALPGVRLERKGAVAALHYRGASEAEAACLDAGRRAAETEGYVMQAGKCVVEVKPVQANKGTALRALMKRPPFAGRRPVMLGDDATDEDAMAAALDLGGVAVKVGAGPTLATHHAESPAEVRTWLAQQAALTASA